MERKHDQQELKTALAKEQRSEEKAIDAGLAAIYGDTRDDLGTMERAGSPVTRFLLHTVIALAVCAAIAYAGYFLYSHFWGTTSADPLTLTLTAPTEIVSGTTATMTITYANTGRVPLAGLSIDCNLPAAFHVTSRSPEPTDANELVWNVGSVARGAEGTITLEGTWLADVPSATNVQALATYRPANFSADFDAVASQNIRTLTSVATLTGEGPDNARSGETATYTFTAENTGESTLSATEFALTLPEGFYLTTSTPPLEPGAAPLWVLGDLAPHTPTVITIAGSFTADIEDVEELHGTLLVRENDAAFAQAEAQVFTDVEGNGLRLNIAANGSTGDVTVDPGSPLRVTVGYENTSDTAMTDLSLLLDFQATGKVPITWADATLDGGTLTADGIRFAAATLGSVGSGEQKTRSTIFPVHETLAAGEVQQFTIVVHATVGGVTIQSQPLTVTLNSDTAFSATAAYFTEDGAPLGEGPLPPTVGQETSYAVVWTLTNALHALKDVRISATLPPSATWKSDVTTDFGEVAYDAATRTMTWTIAALPEDAGTVTARMGISVTPSGSDVGNFVKLLSGSALRATDAVTNASIQLTAAALTTECEGDAGVSGKGAVVE